MLSPMLIQPLVENAFKHAFFSDTKEAVIEVDFSLLRQKDISILAVKVRDNGKGMQGGVSTASKALNILRHRLRFIWESNKHKTYPEPLKVSSSPGSGTTIELMLPLIAE